MEHPFCFSTATCLAVTLFLGRSHLHFSHSSIPSQMDLKRRRDFGPLVSLFDGSLTQPLASAALLYEKEGPETKRGKARRGTDEGRRFCRWEERINQELHEPPREASIYGSAQASPAAHRSHK